MMFQASVLASFGLFAWAESDDNLLLQTHAVRKNDASTQSVEERMSYITLVNEDLDNAGPTIGPLNNLALHRPTTQWPGAYGGLESYYCVDDSERSDAGSGLPPCAYDEKLKTTQQGNCYSICHTESGKNAFWQVSLAEPSRVHSVEVTNVGAHGYLDRIIPFHIFLIGENDNTLASKRFTEVKDEFVWVDANIRNVKTVRIMLDGTNYLHMAEVKVFGTPSSTTSSTITPPPFTPVPAYGTAGALYTPLHGTAGASDNPPENLALGRPTTQGPGTYTGQRTLPLESKYCVDGSARDDDKQHLELCDYDEQGRTTQEGMCVSVCHTNFGQNAFWQVYLAEPSLVETVRVVNAWTHGYKNRIIPFHMYLIHEDGQVIRSKRFTEVQDVFVWDEVNSPNVKTVKIMLDGTNFLHMSEVEVYGWAPAMPPTAPCTPKSKPPKKTTPGPSPSPAPPAGPWPAPSPPPPAGPWYPPSSTLPPSPAPPTEPYYSYYSTTPSPAGQVYMQR